MVSTGSEQLRKQQTTGKERILQQNPKTGSLKKNIYVSSDNDNACNPDIGSHKKVLKLKVLITRKKKCVALYGDRC